MIRRLRNGLLILLCSVLLGVLLLVLTYCLPVGAARANTEKSLYQMLEIRYDPDGDAGRKEIIELKENFTDTLMVQNALEKVEGKSPLEHAMYVYHYDIQDDETTWLTEESLATLLRQGSDGMNLREYSKYWHGYLIFLKPLLMIMSWEHMETFLIVFQVALMAAVVALAFYKKQPFLGLGIIGAFLFMKPIRIWISLAMCICWNITLAALLVLLLFYDKIERKKWRDEFFVLIGIVTAYMDFLTYPIVTLGVPLCIYLVMNQEEEMHWWKRLRQAFWLCACWAAGYIGMWGMKWVVAELTCQTGTLRNALWSVIYRTNPLDGYQSIFSGVSRTFLALLQQYDSVLYTAGFSVIAAAALISVIWCLAKARDLNWGITVICLAVVALFPIGWLILTQNHTAIHCYFTFRILGVSVMALWCMTVCSVRTIRRKARENGM